MRHFGEQNGSFWSVRWLILKIRLKNFAFWNGFLAVFDAFVFLEREKILVLFYGTKCLQPMRSAQAERIRRDDGREVGHGDGRRIMGMANAVLDKDGSRFFALILCRFNFFVYVCSRNGTMFAE